MCLLLIPTSPPKWKSICPHNILIIFPGRKWSNRSYVGISFQLLIISFKYLTYKCMLILMDLRLFLILPKERTKMCFLELFQVIDQRYKSKYRWKSPQWPLCYLKPRTYMQHFSEGSGSLHWSWNTRGIFSLYFQIENKALALTGIPNSSAATLCLGMRH